MDQQEIFKIWIAGFYEGEGCVCNDKSNGNRMRMSISQNDPTPLEKARDIWGGSIQKRVRKSPASDKICTGYEWRLGHRDAVAFFADIEPYFQVPQKLQQLQDARDAAAKGYKARWPCPHCEKDYANPAARRRHVLVQHTEPGKKYDCNVCGNMYASKESLARHVKTNHKNTDASPS